MACRCPAPLEPADPRHKGECCKCGKVLGAQVLSSENIVWFYDRLESCFPGKAPPAFKAFRHECEAREFEGREKFGLSYLSRDNLKEAAEEESDADNYRFFKILQLRSEGRDEADVMDLLLSAAFHAYKAYEFDRRAEARLRGSP